MRRQPAATDQAARADRALARSFAYRLLSQSLTYPTAAAVCALRTEDLPAALEVADLLPATVAQALQTFARVASRTEADVLQREHRRVFTHVVSADCPPNETVYTAKHVFQETLDLGDLSGFYRAFGLELAERERPDHISVELEFMHLVALKEAYARVRHTASRVRLCRQVQRAFLRDHLGRWAPLFAQLLARKAGAGYYAAAAALLQALLASDCRHLRVRPALVQKQPDLSAYAEDAASGCPLAAACAPQELGVQYGRALVS